MLVFKNSGKTEAQDFRFNGDWRFLPRGERFTPTFDELPWKPWRNASALMPGEVRDFGLRRKSAPHWLTQQELDEFYTAGATLLVLWGKMGYRDTFGDDHAKRFHIWLDGGRMRGYMGIGECHDHDD